LDALTARGESSSDVMVKLFISYLAAPDKEFATYIKQKKNDYEECQDVQEDDLMTMAENNNLENGTRHPRSRRRYWR